jgi:hypothetical protein
MIKLTDLLQEQDSFTATSKKSGETVVFKSKDARDSALKAGTHSKIKDSEDGDDKKDTPKVNIFDKPKKKDAPKRDDNTDAQIDDVQNNIGDLDGDEMRDYAESDIFPYLKGKDLETAKMFVDDIEDSGSDFVRSADVRADLKDLFDKKMTLDSPKEEPKSEPSKPKLESDPQAEKVAAEVSKKYGITPEKMGEEDFKVAMGRAVYSALQNSNFHSEARELIAVLEDKPELSKRPDYPSIDDDDYQEKMDVIRQKYASTYTERDDFSSALGRETSDATKWDGVKSVGTLTKQLRDNGMNEFADKIESIFDKKENISTKLMDLLPESIINEGTRSQVGVIGRNGKIVSAYVHYDGYPSNMKPGLKHHMKSDKDVLKLIKMGGARGIFDDKEIEYYKNGKPTKGDMKDFSKYVDTADRSGGAEYIYLYNMKDKKWYFADVYGDKKLKKLF